MRLSHQTKLVLQAFLDAPDDETWGYALGQASGLKPGSLYPILQRLMAEGWLEGRWEQVDERAEGRRRRRYFRLSTVGVQRARAAVDHDSPSLRGLMPGWAAG